MCRSLFLLLLRGFTIYLHVLCWYVYNLIDLLVCLFVTRLFGKFSFEYVESQLSCEYDFTNVIVMLLTHEINFWKNSFEKEFIRRTLIMSYLSTHVYYKWGVCFLLALNEIPLKKNSWACIILPPSLFMWQRLTWHNNYLT